MLQFAVAYFIMLLAMYYNGYIIICAYIYLYDIHPRMLQVVTFWENLSADLFLLLIQVFSSALISDTSFSAGSPSTYHKAEKIGCRKK